MAVGGLLLAWAALARADRGEDPAAYQLTQNDDRAELERGKWLVVSFQVEGKEIANVLPLRESILMSRAGYLWFTVEVPGKGRRVRMDPTTYPKQMDWDGMRGIYRLNNHKLHIAIGYDARPTTFSGKNVKWSLVLRPLRPSDLTGDK